MIETTNVRDLTPQRLARFFTERPDGYQIDKRIRDMVLFAQHDVIMDAPFTSQTYDHPSLFFRPGSTSIQQLQVQGNAAATNYNVAYTRNVFGGVLDDNEGYRRQTRRVNLDSRLTEKLNVGVSANHTRGRPRAGAGPRACCWARSSSSACWAGWWRGPRPDLSTPTGR